MNRLVLILVLILLKTSVWANTTGNTHIDSFALAKKLLEKRVYTHIPRQTLYCQIGFDETKATRLPNDFQSNGYKNRQNRIEWEHIVPAERFGGHLKAWHTGDEKCRTKNGTPYRERRCAERVSQSYRLMHADMYNLYPAVGAVNGARKNYAFSPFFKRIPPAFGACSVKIRSRRVEPPEFVRGIIARTYLYFEHAYHIPLLGPMKRKLMQEWNTLYPVTANECKRTFLIEQIQKNEQPFVKEPCLKAGLWPVTP